MESIIITSIAIITLLAGSYTVYFVSLYLYELYVEYFTTDTDSANPKRSQSTKWSWVWNEGFAPVIGDIYGGGKLVIGGIITFVKGIMSTITFVPNKRTRVSMPQSRLRPVGPPPMKPPRPTKRPRFSSDEILRERVLKSCLDHDKDYGWSVDMEQVDEILNKSKKLWSTEDDVWSTKPRGPRSRKVK